MEYRVIKENDLFLLTDKSGDIPDGDQYGLGLYTRDTRFLSRMEIRVNGRKPVLLSSAADQNSLAVFRLTNAPDREHNLWRESVEIERTRFLHDGVMYERITLTNYYPQAVSFDFSVQFDADFCDMFVVRGFEAGKVGQRLKARTKPGGLVFAYRGVDGVSRETRIAWDAEESSADEAGQVSFRISLQPREHKRITFFVAPVINGQEPVVRPVDEAASLLKEAWDRWGAQVPQVESDMPVFDKLYARALEDLRVLLTDAGYGPLPVAGIPWYAVPFGRDSLIAAWQMLSASPQVARNTLLTMAAFQGSKSDPWRDEQPGKIMHEVRFGELANSNQVPFTPYYGTIDATPLFLILLVEYVSWTGDLAFAEQMLPHAERALEWIDRYGDRDGDGLVEYLKESEKGISNQGWKDSSDAIVHDNGMFARAPIALVEVQGYVYQAKTGWAKVLRALGHNSTAERLEEEAEQLRQRFEEAFWMEDEQYYAIALDADKRQVRSVTSNTGHVLLSGIAAPERARQVAGRLISPDLFSGYGIRTMSTQSSGYNPMSYHCGSVWPHDNALCLAGLAAVGHAEGIDTVITGLLKAAEWFEYSRLPELFCGYDESIGHPVPYPVACSPQAWAAGTPLVMLNAMLGIRPDAVSRRIRLNPLLPRGMNRLVARNLRVGEGRLSVEVVRDADDPHSFRCTVLENTTGWELAGLHPSQTDAD